MPVSRVVRPFEGRKFHRKELPMLMTWIPKQEPLTMSCSLREGEEEEGSDISKKDSMRMMEWRRPFEGGKRTCWRCCPELLVPTV